MPYKRHVYEIIDPNGGRSYIEERLLVIGLLRYFVLCYVNILIRSSAYSLRSVSLFFVFLNSDISLYNLKRSVYM